MKDRRVKNITGLNQIMIDIKPDRCDSDVYINQKIDVTNLVKYMEKKKKENKDITFFHAFMTAIAKVYYTRPKLNYYVRKRHVYEHNKIVISFVAKMSFDDKSEEVMVLVPIDDNDNINTISEKINKKISKIRDKHKDYNKKGANNAITVLAKLPNIIRIPVVGLLKLCDKLGILPAKLVSDNLYYSSVIVSNLGSIDCNAIYHNITNFGICSGLITIGKILDEEVIINGKKEIRKLCEFGVNLDERVADGYYFVKSLKVLEYILNNPELLDDECSNKVEVKK